MPDSRSLTATLLASLALVLPGCDSDVTIVVGDGTILIGVVSRGPTAPVCSPDVPCDEPFAAGFTVTHEGQVVAVFQSADDGRFEVLLPGGGAYRVVPWPDAPILAPESQARDVSVVAGRVNEADLQFDTGIR